MHHSWRARSVLWLSCIYTVLLPQPCVRAQTTPAPGTASGTVVGTVSDPSGARVAHAAVHLLGQGIDRSVTADGMGAFSVSVPPGAYTLSVAFPGFAAYSTDLHIAAASATRLHIALRIEAKHETVVVPLEAGNSTSADDNASALIFQGPELQSFSDDDATFQKELLALGGGLGKPATVFVDGFSGARFPPKNTILAVRLNRNQYSAVYDNLGFGRFEVSTRPGGDKLHGGLNLNVTDSALNAQNPYIGTAAPPYYVLNLDGNLSGSFKKTRFFFNGVFNDQQNNAALVALASATQTTPYSAAVPDPQLTSTFGLRIDRQITATNNLTARYEFNQINQTNGGLTLPLTTADQAYNSGTTTQTLNASDTQSFGSHVVYESLFQYIRTRLQQGAVSSAPTLAVQGAFDGGGSTAQTVHDNQDRYEVQQRLSIDQGAHYLRFGARYRVQRDANLSTQNYNGQFTFPSLAAYLANQPSQFSVTTGVPSATVFTADLGVYAEDEWKPYRYVTLDFGFRLESQSAIPDHLDPAPRFGAAWAVHRKGQRQTFFTLRSGGGIFYDRFPLTDLLSAVRENGVTQKQFFLSNPTGYPQLPSTAALTATLPTVYKVSPNLKSEYGWIGGLTIEKTLPKYGTLSVNYAAIRGVHQFDSQNANAPLPGTYNPAVPSSGTRPLGTTQNVYEFASNGVQKSQVVYVNAQFHFGKRVNGFTDYSFVYGHEDATTASTFASNSFDISQDYGRIPQPTQQLFAGVTVQLPFQFSLNAWGSTQGGTPFNITTGTDLNGDSIFNDRPAFATAPTAASQIYTTRFGTFDANPQPGEKIVPAYFGNSPNLSYLDISATRSVSLGRRPAAPAAVAGKPAPTPPARPYTLSFTVDATNALNARNPGQPVGVLTSPLFGQSISLNNPFSSITAANRIVFLKTSFTF